MTPYYDEGDCLCAHTTGGKGWCCDMCDLPCCGRTPFEVPPTDRMTIDGEVTCSSTPS